MSPTSRPHSGSSSDPAHALTRSQFLDLAGIPPSSLGYERRYLNRQDMAKHESEVRLAVGTLKWEEEGKTVEQSVQLDHEVRMGSGSDCHITVTGERVSNVHLIFYAVRTSSPLALVCMHDLSSPSSGYILNDERYRGGRRYKLGERSFGTRVVVLRDRDRLRIPNTPQVLTYHHNWDSYPLEPLINEGIGDYTLFRQSSPRHYIDTNVWRIHNHPLGEGTFGVVNIATHRHLAVQMACKTIDSRMLSGGDRSTASWRARVKQEVGNMQCLDHPNVLRVFDQIKDRGTGMALDQGASQSMEQGWDWGAQDVWKAHMIFELAAGGDLFSYLEAYGSPSGLSEDEAKFIAWQLVQGIQHIHSKKVAHRDIKVENILLHSRTSFPRILIGDFGSSLSLDAITATVPSSVSGSTMREIRLEGTVNHLPPERLKAVGRKVGTGGLGESLHGSRRKTAIGERWFADEVQLDVWALGIVTYLMVAGRHPYQYAGDRLPDVGQGPLFLPTSDSMITPETQGLEQNGKRHLPDLGQSQSDAVPSPKAKRIGTWDAFRNANTYRTVGGRSTPELREVERLMDAIIAFRNLDRQDWKPAERWAELSTECQDLIASLLCYRAERRASIPEAKEHIWFKAQIKELSELYREIVVQGASASPLGLPLAIDADVVAVTVSANFGLFRRESTESRNLALVVATIHLALYHYSRMRVRIPSAGRALRQVVLAKRRYAAAAPAADSLRAGVVDELERRGFVAALTNPTLRAHLDPSNPRTIYSGVDPSASSLHVGNLLPLLGLLHLTANGHKSLALIGGATGSIGDPSGRSTERTALSPAELERNVAGITAQVHRFFDRGLAYAQKRGYPKFSTGGKGTVEVVNNLEWTQGLGMLDFLRTVGKVARVNIMLSRDRRVRPLSRSVRNRLSSDSGISFTEFSYQLLQAYDFHHLHEQHGCTVQLGGSDQWGNIVAGIDLIKSLSPPAPSLKSSSDDNVGDKKSEAEAYGLTIPLLTTSSGEKFGKSAGNAVWLDEARTSISDFYQFFLRSTDEDVIKYLKLFTLLPLEDISEIEAEHRKSRSKREAQRILAEEITELVHGREAVTRAQNIASVLYKRETRSLRSSEVADLVPVDPGSFKRLAWADIKGKPISKIAVELNLAKSRNDANKLIRSRSFLINDAVVNDPRREVSRSDVFDGHLVVLRVGRNRVVLYIDFD